MRILQTGWLLSAFFLGPIANAQSVEVGTTAELVSAVSAANAAGGNRTILLRDGLYTLTDTLYVNAPNITLAGLSADRTKATVQGDAMSATAKVGNLVRVGAKNFTLHHLTLQRAGWHAIQIAGEADADNAVITDCILRDTYEQIVKVSKDKDGIVTREMLTQNWTDWIDYWSVDFDFENRREIIRTQNPDTHESEESWTGDYIFENEWQSFRTKKNRKLELTSVFHECPPGRRKVAVKVVDIFGNDTMTIAEVNVGGKK